MKVVADYQKGFTLIEVLIALSITSILMLGGYKVLDLMLDSESRIKGFQKKNDEVVRFMNTFELDVIQMAPREVLLGSSGKISKTLPSFIYRPETGLEMSTLNTPDLPGIDDAGARVGFFLREGAVYRRVWIELDRQSLGEYREQKILTGVKKFSLSMKAYPDSEWLSGWDGERARLKNPAMVKLTILHEKHGYIERLFKGVW